MAEETTAAPTAATEATRASFVLPTYILGQEGHPDHFAASTSREEAAIEAKDLEEGDAAFIKRSDLKWTYAIVTEKVVEEEITILRFEVDSDKNRKSFPEAQWGKYIRVIKCGEEAMKKLEAEAAKIEAEAKKVEEAIEEGKKEAEAKIEEAISKDDASAKSGKSTRSNRSNKSGSWFGGIFSGKKEEEAKPETVPEEKVVEPSPAVVETPAEESAPVEAAPEATPTPVETLNTKENSNPAEDIKLTAPKSFLPSKASEADSSNLRSPLSMKTSLSFKKPSLNKIFKKDTPKKVEIEDPAHTADPKSPVTEAGAAAKTKKEWFDPEACEVDYDKNPTDLFQALEARQFAYAEEMFKQVTQQFNKECRTWVIARGQKKQSAQLRFRALPLHAALVFGAPDQLVMIILNAYSKATRGRDVKGRLPIHLAMEHNASEEVVCAIVESFPKGFFAKDKKDMLPLDYVNANMARCHLKKYVPLIADAKVEDERAKWELEKEEALAAQKEALRNDKEYMQDVVALINDEVETTYASKMELLEMNYQKEIELLKKKHDSETQALLEGFEVKLNFERKLNKLKGKA